MGGRLLTVDERATAVHTTRPPLRRVLNRELRRKSRLTPSGVTRRMFARRVRSELTNTLAIKLRRASS